MPCFNLVEVGLSFAVGNFSDRVGRRPLLVSGYLVFALVYLGFAIAPNAAMIWPLFALYGLYSALTRGSPESLRGRSGTPRAAGGRSWHILHADWVGGPASQLNCRMALHPVLNPIALLFQCGYRNSSSADVNRGLSSIFFNPIELNKQVFIVGTE